MNETLNMILTRGSIRKFSNKSVSEDEVELIVQATPHVPNGMGSQTWQFTAMRNGEKIQVPATAIEEALDRQGYDMYQPRILAVSPNEKESCFGREDNACTTENIFLAAHSLGIGSVRVSQLQETCDKPAVRQIPASFGVPSDHVVYGTAVLGYAADTEVDKARTDRVVYVGQSTYAQIIYA